MDQNVEDEIDKAISDRVDGEEQPKAPVQAQDSPRGDWERIGNTRFIASDGIGGEARIEHEGDVSIGVRVSPDSVNVWSREAAIDINVDHEGDQMASWREPESYPQVSGGESPEVTFESEGEPGGLMKVWELGNFRAELKYLRQPDTGDPMDPPWFVKVIGPSGLNGRVEPVWSVSSDDREEAEEKALRQLKRYANRHQNRPDGGGSERPQVDAAANYDPGSTVGYAVFDTETAGFHRSGMFGQVIYETDEAADSAAEPGMFVVEIVMDHLA